MATETALKFVLVGDSNVGKSQLSYRFCKEKFNVSSQSTVGIEFATRTIDINDCLVKSQLWDTAGQERFESMTRAYFRNAVGAVLVYDVTKRQSFENMKNKWLSQLQDFGHEDMYIIIIGNKCDIDPSQHVVRQAEAAEFAESVGLDFIETSAKSGLNVDIAFRRAIISVARLLPHIKDTIKSAALPEGWLKMKDSKGNSQFQNMWTTEIVKDRPKKPAHTGMIINSRRHSDEGSMSFRDSSSEFSDIEKLEQIRKDAGADNSISNSATVALTRDGKDDKMSALCGWKKK